MSIHLNGLETALIALIFAGILTLIPYLRGGTLLPTKNNYSCPECDKNHFSTSWGYKNHMRSH